MTHNLKNPEKTAVLGCKHAVKRIGYCIYVHCLLLCDDMKRKIMGIQPIGEDVITHTVSPEVLVQQVK